MPAQTKKEIKIFKAVFDDIAGKEKIKIFEWGSGFSTIYYAEYLRNKNIEFEWHSIDNDKVWHEKVKTKVRKKDFQPYVQLYLKEFRPFAPSILEEYVNEWFELDIHSPYMLMIPKVREKYKNIIQAVTHEDGTARPQTVTW